MLGKLHCTGITVLSVAKHSMGCSQSVSTADHQLLVVQGSAMAIKSDDAAANVSAHPSQQDPQQQVQPINNNVTAESLRQYVEVRRGIVELETQDLIGALERHIEATHYAAAHTTEFVDEVVVCFSFFFSFIS